MEQLQLEKNSIHDVVYFRDFKHLSSITIDCLPGKTVALSGGRTYAKLFKYWLKESIDCSISSFYPVDERVVPFDHKESNWGNTYRNFLKFVGCLNDKDHHISRVDQYEKLLKNKFGEGVPVFDVIFLGVGDDGHTASLFPGASYLNDRFSTVLQTTSLKAPFDRITLGPKVLLSAKKCITIIAGQEKKDIVTRVLNADRELPIIKILSQRISSYIFIAKYLQMK